MFTVFFYICHLQPLIRWVQIFPLSYFYKAWLFRANGRRREEDVETWDCFGLRGVFLPEDCETRADWSIRHAFSRSRTCTQLSCDSQDIYITWSCSEHLFFLKSQICCVKVESKAPSARETSENKRIMLVSDFYYGRFEGDGSVKVQKTNTTFKCQSCLKILKNNIRSEVMFSHHLLIYPACNV